MLKYFKHTFWKMEAQMLKHHSWSVHAGPAHSYESVNEGSFLQNTRIKQTIKEKNTNQALNVCLWLHDKLRSKSTFHDA